MTNAASHLVDIHATAVSAIPDLIVTQRGEFVVSRFRDVSWDLSPYIHTRNTRGAAIRFDVEFDDGSTLIDARHARLLESAKRFLYERWRVKGPRSGRHISAKTLFNNWSQLRLLLKWMVRNGIASFAEMSPERCLAYAKESKEALKDSSLNISLQILTTYYDLRDHLNDRLPGYPWGDSSSSLIVKGSKPPRKRIIGDATTEIVPVRVLQIIVQKALEYVEQHAHALLRARDEILDIREQEYAKLVEAHQARYPDGFASIYKNEDEYLAVRVGHLSAPQSAQVAARYGYDSARQLKEQLLYLRSACYIVFAAFSGMRDSELASLEIGCFSRREGFDGEVFCWLKGTTYKLERDPRPAEWMVPEVVGKAVAVATRLGAPYRAVANAMNEAFQAVAGNPSLINSARGEMARKLHERERHRDTLLIAAKEKGRIRSFGGAVAAAALRAFARMSGAVVTQEDMEGVRDRDAVEVGKPWPLTPHQFRRTFAVFVARNLMGDVRYLREHFKHWSIDMTLYYSRQEAGIDSTVIEQIMFERDELQAAILEKWINSERPLSGGGGQRIVAFRDRREVKTVSNMEDFCRKLGDDVFVRGTGHSWCLASGSGCGGHGLYDAIRCTSCGEGVIDESHIQIWRGIRDQQIEVLNQSDIGIASRQRCIDHLEAAERVLVDLGESIKPHVVPHSAPPSEFHS
ncbi:integrase [Paraburkholderia sp. BL10I2N1]|uniref:integrase n=1 Tax=Paraburkholderia sp. BL10I2N1 TaxID=1938796 RepID=UPI0010609CD4|nr:integrase [Paraburkholderia sp. BL10I2N1]TDN59001.1 hypothetical protein B0G77_8185 [Paraburkholderia sp. BL10I2N1]